MPHVPINASAKFKGKSKQGLYGDVMMEVDWSVSEILKALKETNLDKNTLVIFTSDNGPWLNFGNHAGSTGGLREGKGTSFEGGLRVPCIMRWSGVIKEGLITNSLATTLDIFPTLAEYAGVNVRHKIDGVSLQPLLKGEVSATPREEFYYYYKSNSLEAVRWHDWKLILPHPSRSYENFEVGKDGLPGPVSEIVQVPQALYDLRRDAGERYDVQKQYPDIMEKVLQLAEKARADLGDEITNRIGRNRREPGKLNNDLRSISPYGASSKRTQSPSPPSGGVNTFSPELGKGESAIAVYSPVVRLNHCAFAGPASFDMSTVVARGRSI